MAWLAQPPEKETRFVRKAYPAEKTKGEQEGFEIVHLPGMGPYALDSFRIFHRDEMLGLADDWLGKGAAEEGFEPEWKRVLPADKELRAYLRWRWEKEGWVWDELTGNRVRLEKEDEGSVKMRVDEDTEL